MRPAYAASFAAALVCHALLLFGFKMETPARPLAISDEPSPVEVSLVASAPEAPPAEASPPPEPAPTPELPPAPTPEMSTPPPEPEATPIPETAPAPAPSQETPVPHPREQKHPPRTTAPAPATLQGGARQGPAARGTVGAVARYLSNPKPDYPEEARRLHQEGVVLLSVEVSADGRPTDITIERGSGSDLLDQAAVRAVKRWTFEPARMASVPVTSRVDVPIRFSLSR